MTGKTLPSLLLITLMGLQTSTVKTAISIFYSFPDRGGISVQTIGGFGPVNVGYARVVPGGGTTAPAGVAIFGYRPGNVLLTETAVPPVQPVQSGRIYAEVSGPVNTGIAIANTNPSAVTISFYFTDVNGNLSGPGNFTVGGGSQVAKFINEQPFNAPRNFVGTLTFTASQPVAVLSLRGFTNERGEFLLNTQTVAPTTTNLTTTQVMAHFVDGGGWNTEVFLVNPTDTTIRGTVQFLNEGSGTVAATPVSLTVNGQIGASFSYSIPAHAAINLTTSGSGTATQTGSVQVTPLNQGSAPAAFALFSFRSNGVTVTQASVPVQPSGLIFRMYAESSGGSEVAGAIDSGVAIANTSTTAATVNLDLTNLDGTSTGLTTIVTVPPLGHFSSFLHELFPTLNQPFRGVLRLNASITPIVVTGLLTRYNERRDFLITTTPASNELSTTTTGEEVFPHFVDMGGYTTQFVLFSGTQYQSGTGTINFFDQTGQPMNVTYQ